MTDDKAPTRTIEPPNELWLTRIFDAPREIVFRCMTEPEHLTHFWGPNRVSPPLERIRVDARPRGRLRDGHGERRGRKRVPDAGRV